MNRRKVAGLKECREARGRSGSCESIEEMWKKKREQSREWEGGDGEIFRKRKQTVRSPDLVKEIGKGVEKMMKTLMREELREVIKEIKKVKKWREEIKKMKKEIKEEVKEGIKEQGKKLRKNLKVMKKELWEQKER